MEKEYLLYLNNEDKLIGTLFANFDSGNEVYSFEYNKDFIKDNPDFFLDPDLYPYTGRQYPNKKLLFGFLSDLMPDRWGRALIDRNERVQSQKENRNIRKLHEIDYLLGVLDISRTGAIRIKEKNGSDFLSKQIDNIPPYISLRKLEQASLDYEDDFYNDNLIKLLLEPGSSLGGARPKANIYSPSGELYIAKLPSKKDDYDVGLWEQVVHDLAVLCGINVPETILEEKKNKYGSIFLSKRFDREFDSRFHYSSAMSLLGALDNDKEKHSYLEIFDLINKISKDAISDRMELFNRVVFNTLINNCDDHLRNHGFIYKNKSWSLSPSFDVNISFDSDIHSLLYVDNDLNNLSNVFQLGKYLNYDKESVQRIITKFSKLISDNLLKLAKKYNAKESEIRIVENIINKNMRQI